MGQVITDNVWIGPVFVAKGTRRADVSDEVAGRVGAHLWSEEEEGSNVSPSGVALSGLRDSVFIDGVLYEKGSVPPDEVIPKVGSHMWADGYTPPPVSNGPEIATEQPDPPPAGPEVASEGDLDGPVPPASSEPDPGDTPPPAGDEPTAAPAASPTPVKAPNRSGQGSSLTAWQAFAAANDVDVHAEAERHEVIEACEKAGLIPVK